VVVVSPLPPLGWGGEWKEKGKRLVGRDKGSLTEQQTKGTVTTMIQIRRIHKTSREMHRCPEPGLTPPHPLPLQPSRTSYGIEYTPVCVSQPGCVSYCLLLKINPVLAKPGTISLTECYVKSSK